MKLAQIVTIAFLCLLFGPYALPEVQQEGQAEKQHQEQGKKQGKPERQGKQAKPEKQRDTQHANPQQRRAQQEVQHKERPAPVEQRRPDHDRQQERRAQKQPERAPNVQPPQQRAQQPRELPHGNPPAPPEQQRPNYEAQQERRAQQQAQPDLNRQPQQRAQQPSVQQRSNGTGPTSGTTQPLPGDRLSQQRQQQLIAQQQQRLTEYRQHLDRQQAVLQAQAAQLQQQKRMAQYHFQEGYRERLRQQQLFLRNDRHPDYDRDPYFYTAPIYRYRRGGRFYETNQYGADFLRQAINYGYEEGYRAGEADREDGWRSNYRDCYAYQDANYGYNGYYVDRSEYNYYFREGFRRGYEDGYNSHFQYGRYASGSYSLLDAILSQILGFQRLR